MSGASLANDLNLLCACETHSASSLAGFYSSFPVFVEAADVTAMHGLIEAVHAVVGLPGYQQAALASAPAVAGIDTQALGVFHGFDFHLSPDGPKLIEINTNAGGALLNAAARWRGPSCCHEGEAQDAATRGALERAFVALFREEWRRARGDRPLRSVAIVDDAPERQHLYPEFVLFRQLLANEGIDAVIADAGELAVEQDELRHRGRRIDLVYNRLTDFYFEEPRHAAMRRAFEEDLAVVTPHPRAHALFADKRNLERLSDAGFLRAIGAPETCVTALLAGIPETRVISPGDESWWSRRKDWFFKPAQGFGSRGAYRGDKITRRAFADVIQGGFVAQRLVPPRERIRFKFDLRHYTYDGRSLLMAARLYQGQTTNFRTAGGGFAPVRVVPGDEGARRSLRGCLPARESGEGSRL
jgi:hypothetical protein